MERSLSAGAVFYIAINIKRAKIEEGGPMIDAIRACKKSQLLRVIYSKN